MKPTRLIPIMALFAFVVCCANPKTDKTVGAAEGSTDTTATTKEMENTPTDVKSFGLLGNVKEVHVTIEDLSPDSQIKTWENYTEHMTFDESGRILKDRFDNLYEYDDKGNFIKGVSERSKMRRDDNGRIVFYEDKKDEEDDEGFTINFEYDVKGRMAKTETINWEATVDRVFTYTDDHIYPDRENWESEDEGDHYSTVITYDYKKFDRNGNWTEREVTSVCKHTTEDDTEGEITESKTIEKREIIYY